MLLWLSVSECSVKVDETILTASKELHTLLWATEMKQSQLEAISTNQCVCVCVYSCMFKHMSVWTAQRQLAVNNESLLVAHCPHWVFDELTVSSEGPWISSLPLFWLWPPSQWLPGRAQLLWQMNGERETAKGNKQTTVWWMNVVRFAGNRIVRFCETAASQRVRLKLVGGSVTQRLTL